VEGFGKPQDIDYTDGVRIIFNNGEISHLRPSGNAPEFRITLSRIRRSGQRDGADRYRKVIPALAKIASSGGF